MSRYLALTNNNLIIEIRGRVIKDNGVETFVPDSDIDLSNYKYHPQFSSFEEAKSYLVQSKIESIREAKILLESASKKLMVLIDDLSKCEDPDVKILGKF